MSCLGLFKFYYIVKINEVLDILLASPASLHLQQWLKSTGVDLTRSGGVFGPFLQIYELLSERAQLVGPFSSTKC